MNKYLTKVKRFFHFGDRSFNDYKIFIEKAQNHGFEFVPLKSFRKQKVSTEKIIGLRHDVDSNLNHAIKIAKIEHALGVKSTYFVLHTAKYFYENILENTLNKNLIKKLQYLQNDLGHEIGLHTDLMPIEIIYKKDPINYVINIITLLRENGIKIVGIAPHGNLFHHIYRKKYIIGNEEKKNNIFADPYTDFDVKMFNIDYEAYSLTHDKYLSDASFLNNKRWDFSYVDDDFFKNNGRTIISTHPIHWAQSKFYYFSINFMLTVRYFFSYVNEFFMYKRSK